jgi:hypothetical protein
MTESPYAIPEDDLVTSARVPIAEQVEVQSEPRPDAGGWTGPNPVGDGTGGDADGE